MKINKVIGIAVKEYEDTTLNKLTNCYNDVSAIIKVLNDKYIIDDIEFLFEKKDTTRKVIVNKLNEYFTNRLIDENVLLIYAGHSEYNEKLKTPYSQPSDADPSDLATWINFTEILTFIKASEAFHIAIIADTCFSGAIFEPQMRGGGIVALDSKKSRLALTSGSVEKVSDGQSGQLSPFSQTLVKILEKNTQEELPLSVVGTELILNFNTKNRQTPMFGPLPEVGHEGGSFIFKIKPIPNDEYTNINNKNKFLKEQMGNLFIPICEDNLNIINKIQAKRELKTKAVKEQDYVSAAKYRDEEKDLREKLKIESIKDINSLLSEMTLSTLEIEKSKELDIKIIEYNQLLKTESRLEIEEYERLIKEDKLKLEEEQFLKDFLKSFIHFKGKANPAKTLFSSERPNFLIAYKKNIVDMYEIIFRLIGSSKNEYLSKKIEDLKEIILDIYSHEIALVTKGYRNDLEEIISIKELDIKVLNWIKSE